MKTYCILAAAFLAAALVAVGPVAAQEGLGISGYAANLADATAPLPGDSGPAAKAPVGPVPGCGFDDCDEGFCPRWTFKVGALALKRSRPDPKTLVTDSYQAGGTVLLDANDFSFDWRGGIDVSLVRHNVRGTPWDLEARYFRVDGFNAFVPTVSSPGGAVIQYLTPIGNTAFASDVSAEYASHLDSFELNMIRPVGCGWLSVLGGFRFLELDERNMTITQDIGPGLNTAVYSNGAINDLYGFQFGANARVFSRGRLSVDYLVKAGAYDNLAVSRVSVAQQSGPSFACRARTNHGAFLCEMALSGTYEFNDCLALRVGYQLMWLEGVTTADKISTLDPFNGTATVDTTGSPFYHGALISLEFNR